jgi:hypothetical protein
MMHPFRVEVRAMGGVPIAAEALDSPSQSGKRFHPSALEKLKSNRNRVLFKLISGLLVEHDVWVR